MNIHIISPSGYCPIPKFELALQKATQLGYSLSNQQVGYRKYLRFGGNDIERITDFDINIQNSIVMPIRGGYGLNRIIDDINWHKLAEKISTQNLKIVGHSDFTLVHMGLMYAKAVSFAGPMFTSDFGVENINSFMLENFHKAMLGNKLIFDIKSDFDASGIIWGGNLAMLTSIIGTKYIPNIEGILFLEDVNEHPYRVERMLWQMFYSGILQNQKAIILGRFSDYKLTDYDNGYNFDNMLDFWRNKLDKYNTKIATNLYFGHCYDKVTIPIGANCILQNQQLIIEKY